MIRKTIQGFDAWSENGRHLGGPYPTRGEARDRLQWAATTKRAKASGKPPAESAVRKGLRAIGEASGASALARLAVGTIDETIRGLTARARAMGVPERTIQRALGAQRKLERAQSLASLIFPGLPSPAILRALAGKEKS